MFIYGPTPAQPSPPERSHGPLVAVGAYDGMHRAHQAALRHLRGMADEMGVSAGIVTFDEPPSRERRLTTLEYRLELIEQTHLVDEVWVVPTGDRPATPEAFVRDVLVDRVRASGVALSKHFGLGYDAVDDIATAERLSGELGYDVVGLDEALEELADLPCSIDGVTARLSEGDVAGAAQLLGRWHEMRGVVEQGDQRGRTLGFPTANMAIPSTLVIPREGVYAGLFIDEDGVPRPTAISLGRRPTFYKEGHELLEAHVLDFDGDLYGHVVRVQFLAHLRGQIRFGSVDELVAQLHKDIAATRQHIGEG